MSVLALNKYRPVEIDDLARYGRDFDGGYVIPSRCVVRTKTLLSFGVNDDWSFEKDFLRESDARLLAYDYSVEPEFFSRRRRLNMARLLWHWACLKPSLDQVRQIIADTRLRKDFCSFFDGQRRIFIKKFLGFVDDEHYISFATIFKNLGNVPPQYSVFVKMDIEDWEYRTLPTLEPWFDCINGLVVEFHNLDICRETFESIMSLLMRDFYIVHVHGNADGGLVYGTQVPRVLELTFVNKSLLAGQIIKPSALTYPVPGLDFSCRKDVPDLPLNFS